MKTRFGILFSVLLLGSSLSFSQVKPFRFGFKLASNLAWLSPDANGYKVDGSVMGFSWGFLSDFALTENYFVATGFSMDYLGGKLLYPHAKQVGQDTTLITGDLARKYKLRNLELPLTIKMRTNKFGDVAFFGKIGFGIDFNLNAKADDSFSYYSGVKKMSETIKDVNVKDEIVFLRSSMIFGAGIEYFIDESTSILLGLNFNSGMTNVLKGENVVDPSVKQKANLNYFQLNMGVLF
jgi:hypothetical protein